MMMTMMLIITDISSIRFENETVYIIIQMDFDFGNFVVLYARFCFVFHRSTKQLVKLT